MPQEKIHENRPEHRAERERTEDSQGRIPSANPNSRILLGFLLETCISLGFWELSNVFSNHNYTVSADICACISLCSLAVYAGMVAHDLYPWTKTIVFTCTVICVSIALTIFLVAGGSMSGIVSTAKGRFVLPTIVTILAALSWVRAVKPKRPTLAPASGTAPQSQPAATSPTSATTESATTAAQLIRPEAPNKLPDRRTFVHLSPDQLFGLVSRQHMGNEAERIVKPYLGKWIEVSGKVENITVPNGNIVVRFSKPSPESPWLVMLFGVGWKDRLDTLISGQQITVAGMIHAVSNFWGITLWECELVATTSPPATSSPAEPPITSPSPASPPIPPTTSTAGADAPRFAVGKIGFSVRLGMADTIYDQTATLGSTYGYIQITPDENGNSEKYSRFRESLSIYVENWVLCVDSALIIEGHRLTMIHNEIVDIPGSWSAHSDEHGIEVVDTRGRPMLQIIFRSQRDITINGVFSSWGLILAILSGVSKFPVYREKEVLEEMAKLPLVFPPPGPASPSERC